VNAGAGSIPDACALAVKPNASTVGRPDSEVANCPSWSARDLSSASAARASGVSRSPRRASSSNAAALPDRSASGNSTSNATSRA
jgi:hypothetical protein